MIVDQLLTAVDPANAALLIAIYSRLDSRLGRVERAIEARHDVSFGD